ncbi:unnamed protein product [Protopolystoma xenopodis]|uniref:PH domain-containing protein n=1 Tax=Protopolystoma xenopodis TaxID=117903 RepID=A0A448WB58_9PLAT|nr:unnamed protein product [Protopolystoma xenopodis]
MSNVSYPAQFTQTNRALGTRKSGFLLKKSDGKILKIAIILLSSNISLQLLLPYTAISDYLLACFHSLNPTLSTYHFSLPINNNDQVKRVWQRRRVHLADGQLWLYHADESKAPVKLALLTCQVKQHQPTFTTATSASSASLVPGLLLGGAAVMSPTSLTSSTSFAGVQASCSPVQCPQGSELTATTLSADLMAGATGALDQGGITSNSSPSEFTGVAYSSGDGASSRREFDLVSKLSIPVLDYVIFEDLEQIMAMPVFVNLFLPRLQILDSIILYLIPIPIISHYLEPCVPFKS